MDPLIITLVILGVMLITCWIVYNSLVTAHVRVSEALSHIDVQLKRRTDLIPNLVEAVKGYAKHEKELLEDITKARASLVKADSAHDKAKANNVLSESLKSLFAVSENYPDLKANQNFLNLQEELADTENKIAYSRQFYNTNVLDYNTKLTTFPSMIFGNLFKFRPAEFFEADEADKKPVKVSF
ncbi:MAG TPA: LemA family protein [Patescibacteria group bacterium]